MVKYGRSNGRVYFGAYGSIAMASEQQPICPLHGEHLPCKACSPVQLPRLSAVKTDIDLAREFKQQLGEAMLPVLAVLEAAKREGFDLQFGVGTDAMGRAHITQMQVVKVFS